jgi:hypothetical protein
MRVEADGTTFDDVTPTVAEPVDLALTCAMNNEDGPVPSTLTQPCFLGRSATDQSGNALMATM